MSFLKSKYLWFVVGGIVLGAIALKMFSKPPVISEKPIFKVEVVESRAQNHPFQHRMSGTAEGSERVTLKSEIKGLIKKTHVSKGSRVKAGQLLVTLTQNELPRRIEQAQSKLKQKELELQAAQKLYDKGYMARSKFFETQSSYEEARATLESAQKDLSKTEIRAPIDGGYEYSGLDEGEFVDVGSPLGVVVSMASLKIKSYVSADETKILKEGAPCQLEGDPSSTGSITHISGVSVNETRSYLVESFFPKATLSLRDGQTLTLFCGLGTQKAHLISPGILSLSDDGKLGVKLLDDQEKVLFTPIQVVQQTEKGIWVVGLPEKALLISLGQEYVVSGQKVDFVLKKDKA